MPLPLLQPMTVLFPVGTLNMLIGVFAPTSMIPAIAHSCQPRHFPVILPADRAVFQKRAKDGAEFRFQAGIHFRTDNEVALEMGRKVAGFVIQKIKGDGADDGFTGIRRKKN